MQNSEINFNEILEQVDNTDADRYRNIMDTLKKEPFNCKHPLLAIEMIKRKVRNGSHNLITREDIQRWGNRE